MPPELAAGVQFVATAILAASILTLTIAVATLANAIEQQKGRDRWTP